MNQIIDYLPPQTRDLALHKFDNANHRFAISLKPCEASFKKSVIHNGNHYMLKFAGKK